MEEPYCCDDPCYHHRLKPLPRFLLLGALGALFSSVALLRPSRLRMWTRLEELAALEGLSAGDSCAASSVEDAD